MTEEGEEREPSAFVRVFARVRFNVYRWWWLLWGRTIVSRVVIDIHANGVEVRAMFVHPGAALAAHAAMSDACGDIYRSLPNELQRIVDARARRVDEAA